MRAPVAPYGSQCAVRWPAPSSKASVSSARPTAAYPRTLPYGRAVQVGRRLFSSQLAAGQTPACGRQRSFGQPGSP